MTKYKVYDILRHKETGAMFMVDSVSFPKGHDNPLYALKVLNTYRGDGALDVEDDFKRYYQSKIDDMCKRVVSSRVANVLYGKQ